ncbi:MAG: TolC family protein, partial [Bacillota bacterium]
MFIKSYVVVLAVLVPFQGVRAETLPLSQVWQKIHAESSAQKASDLQVQAAGEAKDRASRHWLPHVYLDAKSYQTNDPGASFFGLLSQRSLQQSDFNPDSINHPDAHLYTRGALGVDLPLYEGGMKSSQAQLQEYVLTSQQKTSSSVQVEQYAEVAKAYGAIGVLNQQKQKLTELSQMIERLLKSYQLGVKSNPVGYSGLLGLRSLSNRLQGLLKQYEAQSQAYYAGLKEMGLENSNWSPQFDDSIKYVEKYLVSKEGVSYKVEAMKESSKVASEAANMEKARFLPRVGAFAEGYMFNGDRDTANGYTAGLYLQWNLFNPSDYGTLKEARLKSMAAEKYSEAIEQRERAEGKALEKAIAAYKENLQLLNDSQ